MRVLVQNTKTQEFLTTDGGWTNNQDGNASDFGTSVGALTFCLQNHFEDVQIVLSVGDPQYDVTLPIPQPSSGL